MVLFHLEFLCQGRSRNAQSPCMNDNAYRDFTIEKTVELWYPTFSALDNHSQRSVNEIREVDNAGQVHVWLQYTGLCQSCFASLSRTESARQIPYSDFWDWSFIRVGDVRVTETSKAGTEWVEPEVYFED